MALVLASFTTTAWILGCGGGDEEAAPVENGGSAGAGGSLADGAAGAAGGGGDAKADVAPDATPDGSADGKSDGTGGAGGDASVDPPVDGAGGATGDAPADAAVESSGDGATDAGADAKTDASQDAPADAPGDAASDADAPLAPSKLSAVWANDGGDKVTRDDLRKSTGKPVTNTVYDGQKVVLFAAKNEVVSFNLVLEAQSQAATGVSIALDTLNGPGGKTIHSTAASGDGVFDWSTRPIELFYVRYLPIKGLSKFGYDTYDERHVPVRLRRPWTGQGVGSGGWANRPDHDKEYPEIAQPLELSPTFTVAQGKSQSIWVDIYVPKTASTGLYAGAVTVKENGSPTSVLPVELTVKSFTLPDQSASRTMLVVGDGDVNKRYTGVTWPNPNTPQEATARLVRNRHFQLAHRHRVALVGDTAPATGDKPEPDWTARFDGTLYSAAKGYGGPGESTGHDVYSIGTYGSWGWQSGGQSAMNSHSNAWVTWFDTNAPGVDYFLYLIDESSNFPQIQQWGTWLHANPGVGNKLRGFATIELLDAVASTPALDIAATTMYVGDTPKWDAALASWKSNPKRRFYMYNGHRPASGSFSTEDDGIALRELPWGQYKKGIDRWFFWESTYYDDFQSGRGQNNLFHDAQTFGATPTFNAVVGMTSGSFSNGDGVLFYPGTDTVFPADSLGVKGPLASLRLKHWRRGIQDVDYIVLASAKDAAKTKAVVDAMVPKVLWEYGVNDVNDPTWVLTDISWSPNPDDWEKARAKLSDIIEGK